MNDEFLFALRREPPLRFASELKRRLDLQVRCSRRMSIVRTIVGLVLIGGAAMAAALLLRDGREPAAQPVSVARVASRDSPIPKADSAPLAGPVVADGRTAEPLAATPAAADLPGVTVLTSMLARPLAQALVEHVDGNPRFQRPRVTVAESNEAFAALCRGTEFVIASRRMVDIELTRCRQAGIEVYEWKLGHQAVVLTAGPLADPAPMSVAEVYRGLARRVPDQSDLTRLIDNPAVSWTGRGIAAASNIDVLAPTDAAVRELFVSLVIEPGCNLYETTRQMRYTEPRRYDEACRQLRTDGRYREVPLSNTLITQQLWADPNQLLVLGYSFYAAHRNELRSMLEGPAPTRATLEDGTYGASRPVYAYATLSGARHPVGMWLAVEFTEEFAVGPRGYLQPLGLVSLDQPDRRVQRPWPDLPPKLESLSQ